MSSLPARTLLTKETHAACVRKHLQCSVKQELLQLRLQQAGERGRLGRTVKRKLTGEREGNDGSKETQSQTGERRRGLQAVGETKQERCETWLHQKCNANAKMLKQAVPKPKMVMQRQEEERVGKEGGGGREEKKERGGGGHWGRGERGRCQ